MKRLKKKSIVKLLGSILLLSSIILHTDMEVYADNIYFKGSGTKEEPYEITTGEELVTLSKLLDGELIDENYSYQYYQLENSIDMSDIEDFKPIGNSYTYDFEGTFDGNGYEISNLVIKADGNTSSDVHVGLFGVSSGTIKNLGVVDSTFEANNSGAVYVGSIVGTNSGVITNSYSNSTVSARGIGSRNVAAGGLVGQSFGGIKGRSSIVDSYNKGTILAEGTKENGNVHTGGIVGLNHTGDSVNTLSDLYNTGTIVSTGNSGGIVGSTMKSYVLGENEVIHSYNVGEVFGETSGGIVGNMYDTTTITESFNRGYIHGELSVGGVVGYQYKGKISNNYNEGIVKGVRSIGGIVGETSRGIVTNNYNVGSVTVHSSMSKSYVGGIIGEAMYASTISNNYYKDNDNVLLSIGNDRKSKEGRSKEALTYSSTFKDYDFIATWVLEKGKTPKLRFNYILMKDIQLEDMDLQVGDIVNIGKPSPLEATSLEGNWSSSSPVVATVDSYGTVTAIGGGEATITYRDDDNHIIRKSTIRVKQLVDSISFSTEKETIGIGEGKKIVAEVTPETANNKELSWKSSDESIATINELGEVKGIREGNVTITATSKDGSNIIATMTLSVVDKVESISITSKPNKRYYEYGEDLNLEGGKLLVTYQSGKTKTVDMTNTMISEYNSKTLGKQVVKVMYGNKTAAFTVSVKLSTPSLVALPKAYNIINIKYNNVRGATGYRIYRSTSKNGTYKLIKETSNTSYNDTNVIINTNYYYKVRAYQVVNSTRVYGDYSSVNYAKTKLNKVLNVNITKRSASSTDITWDGVKGAKGYRIYAYDHTAKKYIYIGDTKKTNITHKNIRKGRKYTYKIRGYQLINKVRVYGAYSTGKSIKM